MKSRHLISFLLLGLAACGDPPVPAEYLVGAGVRHEIVDTARLATVELVHVRDIGDSAGPNAFARLTNATVLGGGRVALYDEPTCAVILIDGQDPAPDSLPRIGRCGDGPGELRRLQAMSAIGDTLVFVPLFQSTLVAWSDEGRELERILLDGYGPEVGSLRNAMLLDSTRGVLIYEQPPGPGQAGDTSAMHAVRMVDLRAGEVLASGFPPPPVTREHPGNLWSGPNSCLSQGEGGSGVVLAIHNVWAFEGLVIPLPEFGSPSGFMVPGEVTPHPIPPPGEGFFPRDLRSTVVCGSEWIAFHRWAGRLEGRTPHFGEASILFTDRAGRPLGIARADSAAASKLGIPVAARGDRLWFVNSSGLEYPVLREFRVRLPE